MPHISFGDTQKHTSKYKVYNNVSYISHIIPFQGYPKIYQAFSELLGTKPIRRLYEIAVFSIHTLIVCYAHCMNDFLLYRTLYVVV